MGNDPLTMTWYTGRAVPGSGVSLSGDDEFASLSLLCGHYDLLDASIEGPWGSTEASNETLSGLYAKLYVVRTLDHETLYDISDVRDYNNVMWQLPMRTEFLQASWHFCEQVYSDVSVDLGVLSVGNVTRNPLTLVDLGSSDTLYSNASGLNYSISNVYKGNGGKWDPSALSQFFDLHLGYNLNPWGGSATYSSSASSDISYSIVDGGEFVEGRGGALDSASGSTRSLSIYLRSADIEALTNTLASTLTARIRSNYPGGNANLTMLPGQAFVKEAYIAVQWPWMILPIMETVLAAAALAITIVLTRQQALLKGSTVSLLMHQIDGWSPEETRVRRLDTSEQLRDRAKKMVVRLDEGQNGEMVFKR